MDAIERLEAEIDMRCLRIWAELAPVTKDRVMTTHILASLIRVGYAQGYGDAMRDDGEMFRKYADDKRKEATRDQDAAVGRR